MPSEQQQYNNWDRRRRHEGGGGRWRHTSSSSDSSRWGAPRRSISGHGKQGNRNLYLDEFGHGLMPSRTSEKMPEDDSSRPSDSGRYGRYSRDYRGSSVQKDWKSHPSEIAPQPNGSRKLKSTSDQRSVDVMPSHNSSTPSSDSIDSRDQSLTKYQHENNDVGSMSSTGQKLERENSITSINWQPLKWSRSESLSVRNSGFIHSSSSKNMERDTSNMNAELMQENAISVLSHPGAGTAGFAAETSNPAAEVMNSRKKPRLGWGEGLAKYEKKKVESSDESEKNGATPYGSNLEHSRSYASNCFDKSPKRVMVPQCASPATPSSVAYSSSHGMEEKQVTTTGSTDHDNAYICNSMRVIQNNADRSFDLGELDLTTNFDLNSSIEELLKYDDSTVDSSFVRSTAMNKLLLLKNHISKEVETTETEIDLLENELKKISESGRSDNHLYASSSVPVARLSKPYDNSAAPNDALRLAGLYVVVDSNVTSKDDHCRLKDVDVDSPGSATSKFVDAFPPKMSSSIEVIGDPGLNMLNLEMEPEMDRLIKEKPITDGIGSQLVGCSSVSSDDDSLDFCREDFSRESILASNRDCEQIASEVINKLLPSSYHFDFSSVVKASCVQNDLVKERFLRKRYYYKLKEKILILKFKILWHLWKEDVHIRSLKKFRGKTQKKFELSSRKPYRSYQKYRPSARSRCFSTGVSLLASTELRSYASKLLAEPQLKPLRSELKMPSMIFDKRERMATRFISYNGLVEDPVAAEKEQSIIQSWSEEDKELFIDKLAQFGKDFRKIAISLGHRTRDCVEFYYKNHKSDAFKRAKKKPEFSNHSTMPYLLTSEQRLNLEADAASQKVYGGVSAVASMIDDFVEVQQKHTSKSIIASGSYKMENGGDNLVDRSSSQCLYTDERETVAADVLFGICCSRSSEAMSSCITSSLDPGGGYQDHMYHKIGSSTRRPLTPEVIQNVVETCYDESCGVMDPTDWTDEEKTLLIQAVSSYGKDFTMISRCVRTKTHDQCKVFFSKARKCLGLDKTCSGSEKMITDDVICNGKSGLRIDEDIASVNMKLGQYPVKPDLHSAQGIVVGNMDSTHSLASKNLLPDDQGLENNFELAPEGNDGSKNSTLVASNLDVAHGVEQTNVENLPNLVNLDVAHGVEQTNVENLPNLVVTEDGSDLVFNGSHGNGSRAEEILELDVADDVGQGFTKNLPKVSETETQSRHLHAACITVPEAKSTVERCLYESNLRADGLEAKETSMRCSLRDEHPGVHLACNNVMQRMLESHDEEKPLVLQQPSSASVDQGFTISTIKHGNWCSDDEPVVPEKMRGDEQMLLACSVEQLPMTVSTVKKTSSDVSCKPLIPEASDVAQHLGRDFRLQSCHSRKYASSDAEPASAHREGDLTVHPSGSQPHINKLSTNGDFKLFGQILSKTSQKKAISSAPLIEVCSSQHHSLGSESSSVKCCSCQQAGDGISAHMNHTRYPTAFGNDVPPSSKIVLPSSNGVGKSGECTLNGVPTLSNKDSVSNGLADLHMFRNPELQSLSMVAQMERGNGFDVVPGLQQQSGDMVAINVVGRKTVLGGQFVGVSDPVAAIKMHYAKSEQHREDDPCKHHQGG